MYKFTNIKNDNKKIIILIIHPTINLSLSQYNIQRTYSVDKSRKYIKVETIQL